MFITAALTGILLAMPMQADTPKKNTAIEEIVITAQKREESLLQAPLSVSAFTSEALKRSAIEDLADLSLFEPSLITNQVNSGGANVFIRGVGNEIIGVGTDSSVAVYLDGVYLPRFTTALQNFIDVERVEVVKGPQGTLYGRNATGGAINVITKQPSAEPEFNADLQFSNYSGRQIRLAGGGSLIADTLMARASLTYSERDHYSYNAFLDQRLKGEDLFSITTALKWVPNDNLEFLLRYDHSKDKALGLQSVKVSDSDANAVNIPPGITIPADPYVINSDLPDTRGILDGNGASLVVNWTLGDFLLTSQTAWREFKTDLIFDSDGLELPLNHFFVDEVSESFSQELRLQHQSEGPFEWMAGVFYFDEDANQLLNVFGVVPILGDLKVEAWAAFAEASYQMTERLKLTAGIRYSYEEKDHLQSTFGVVSPASTGVEDWAAFTPRFVASYDISDDVFAYASISRGFKSGGFNSVGNTPAVDPEFLTSYETGLKGTFFDGILQLTSSLFYYDYEDLQVRTILDAVVLNENAAKAELIGLEFAANWSPVEEWLINASFAYLDTEYKEYIAVRNIGGVDTPVDVSGNRLNQAPEFKSALSVQYSWGLGDIGSLRLRGEYTYVGDYFYSQFNDPIVAEDGYDLFNASLTWIAPNDKLTVSVWGRNLSDELYKVQVFDTLGYTRNWLGAPRTYGIRASYAF